MPPLTVKAALTIEADADGDGVVETGVFEMASDIEVVPDFDPAFEVSGAGDRQPDTAEDGTPGRRGYYRDAGGGGHTVDISFQGWQGATDGNGNSLQWGEYINPIATQTSATGQQPFTQIDVLMRYLTVGRTDSATPATLEYGEYHEDGLYEPHDVAVTKLTQSRSSSEGQRFSGSLSCTVIRSDEDDTGDARAQHDW